MRESHGRVRLVHVLAAGAARAICVDPNVALVDLDLGVVREERARDHLRERRVAAVCRVVWGEANEPMLAALGPEDAVGVLAGDRERRRLEAGLLPRARFQDLGLK